MASTQNADAVGPVKSRDIELGRELGSRPVPTHIARLQRPNAEPELVIATRIDRAGPLTVDEAMDLSRVARLLSRNPHPNLTRVRDVVVRDTDMLVVEGYLDGQSLGELWRTARARGSPLPLAVSLRIILDVLSGLEAFHGVRLAAGQPADLVHGEVTPGNVIVGQDGITRLIHTCRVASAWSSVPDAPRYVAPEILMRDRELDGRADLYSVGALLWEAISGKPAIEASSAAAVVKHLARGPLPSPVVPRNARWAEPVVLIAMRALSPDRDARYEQAGTMRDELLEKARARIAPPEDVARWVRQLAGTVIQERRKRFANEAEARLSIDVEVSSPGIPLPDRSAAKGQEAIETTPAPAMPAALAEASRPPPPPPIAAAHPAPVAPPLRVAPSALEQAAPARVPEVVPLPASQQPALSPATTPAMVEVAGEPEAQPGRKGNKKAAWIAVAACLLVGVVFGTWLGLRAMRGSEPQRSAAAPAVSSAVPAGRVAEPVPLATVAAEPPTTARPEEPRPAEGGPAGQPPVARAMPGGVAGAAAANTSSPEPSQAAPAATPDPIPGPPPRPTKRDPEPPKTKGKYQPLGI